MREPRKRQQAAAAARNNVAPVERSTNLMEMPLDEFQGALAELAQQGVDTDALLRQYRAASSPFAAVNRAVEASSAELAAAGRRPVSGSAGLLSRSIDDAGGVRFEPAAGLLGMLAGAGRQIDAPMAAYQELIPAEDMDLEALGTAGVATLGGGAVTRPAGPFGMGGRVAGETKPQRIARLLREGRQSEVTDDLLGSLTPDENAALFRLYDEGATGMDLPMDAASRMARAGEILPQDAYHSTGATFSEFIPSAVGRHGMGVYTGKNRLDVESFLPRDDATKSFEPGAQTLPLRIPGESAFASEMKWQDALPERWAYGDPRDVQDAIEGYASGADVLSQAGYKGVMQPATDWEGRVVFNPANIRSRFARFDPRLTANANLLAANASPEAGLLSAAAARTPAEQMARQILDMRAAGRAGDVTDEMMAAADPQYMFANTPLPMDEASRRDRAAERFDIQPLYHGTASDVQGFDNNQRGSITQVPSARAAHWLTGRYDVAGPYADLAATKPVQDLMDASRNAEIDGNWDLAESLMADAERLESIGGSGQNVMQLYGPRDVLSFDAKGASYDPTDYPLMDKVAAAKNDGYQAVRINDFVDNADWGSGRAASHIGVFNPANIRSRFARFDPEFAHLSNLSAANIDPLSGLFGAMAAEEQRRRRNAP
jgi:hypothetical protein